jgi:PAS domain-containing protein
MVEVSDGFCALVGRPRGEILGKTADQLGISDRARLDWLIDRFPQPGRSHRQRRVFQTPEGPRLMELDIDGIELAGERMIVSVITPVPADEPHGDVEVLAAVLDAAPLGMVLFGPDLRIVRVNRAVERIGTIRPEHLGVRLLDAFPQVSPEIVAAVRGVFAGGEPAMGLASTGAPTC